MARRSRRRCIEAEERLDLKRRLEEAYDQDDWRATCKLCGRSLKGTLEEIRKGHDKCEK